MQEIRSSNPPVVAGICDPNKSRAQQHILKFGSKLKYLNIKKGVLENFAKFRGKHGVWGSVLINWQADLQVY